MNRGLLPTAMLLAAFTASGAGAAEYKGICEASAGAFIDSTHFVVASDETNKLQIYERGKPQPIGNGIDMETFTSFDKSDLEAAAVIGDRVYWISSHSFNSQGEDKSKRKVFFATKIVQADGKPTLVSVGKPVKSLRDPLAKAAGVKPDEMNIEALTATPDGGLLIGLRAPLRDGMALVVPFKNPAAVVDDPGTPPDFGAAVPVKLEDRGFRSMETLGSGTARIRHRRRPRFRQGGGICAVPMVRPRDRSRGGQRRGFDQNQAGGSDVRPRAKPVAASE